MSPEKAPMSAQDQIARDGFVSEVPGFSQKAESVTSVDDGAEKQEADSGRVLSVGERVLVLRNQKPGSTEKWVDHSGWKVVETNPSTTTVEKIMPNGVEVSTKTVVTAELVDLQERLKLRRDLGEGAVEDSGIRKPDSESAQPIKSEIEVPAVETKKEMLDRHVREYQAELSGFYKEHRGLDPKSVRAAQLENLINQTKEDIGRVDRERRKL